MSQDSVPAGRGRTHLASFKIESFQSFGQPVSIDFEPGLTLIAGRNNVGKSAMLRGLRLLTDAQDGVAGKVSARWSWRIDDGALRARVARQGQGPVFDWLVGAQSEAGLLVSATFVAQKRSGQVLPNDFSVVEVGLPEAGVAASGEAGTQLGWTSGPFEDSSVGIEFLVELVRDGCRRSFHLSPRRVEQGRRQLRPQALLDPDGRNLTDVLLRLQMNEPDSHAAVLKVLRETFPEVRGVTVRQDDGQDAALAGEPVLYFETRTDPVPLRHCGTGIEQMLTLAVAIVSESRPRLFLIDEPQAYLHPHAERGLMGLLEAHPQHQYIVATHSHVMLRACSLSQVRMLHLEDGQTRVIGDPAGERLLSELQVTAADLWLNESVLWVEGPTEEEVLGLVAAAELRPRERISLQIRRMPDSASRFATKNQSNATAAYRFCTEATRAVAPLPIKMRFLFDADEKSPEDRHKLGEASGGRAEFLPVREIENLFLDASLLSNYLSGVCKALGLPIPESMEVADELNRLLEHSTDVALYPTGLSVDRSPSHAVRGSEVLSRLWWQFATARYDKVRDGKALTALALREQPQLLEPLVGIVRRALKT